MVLAVNSSHCSVPKAFWLKKHSATLILPSLILVKPTWLVHKTWYYQSINLNLIQEIKYTFKNLKKTPKVKGFKNVLYTNYISKGKCCKHVKLTLKISIN